MGGDGTIHEAIKRSRSRAIGSRRARRLALGASAQLSFESAEGLDEGPGLLPLRLSIPPSSRRPQFSPLARLK